MRGACCRAGGADGQAKIPDDMQPPAATFDHHQRRGGKHLPSPGRPGRRWWGCRYPVVMFNALELQGWSALLVVMNRVSALEIIIVDEDVIGVAARASTSRSLADETFQFWWCSCARETPRIYQQYTGGEVSRRDDQGSCQNRRARGRIAGVYPVFPSSTISSTSMLMVCINRHRCTSASGRATGIAEHFLLPECQQQHVLPAERAICRWGLHPGWAGCCGRNAPDVTGQRIARRQCRAELRRKGACCKIAIPQRFVSLKVAVRTGNTPINRQMNKTNKKNQPLNFSTKFCAAMETKRDHIVGRALGAEPNLCGNWKWRYAEPHQFQTPVLIGIRKAGSVIASPHQRLPAERSLQRQ